VQAIDAAIGYQELEVSQTSTLAFTTLGIPTQHFRNMLLQHTHTTWSFVNTMQKRLFDMIPLLLLLLCIFSSFHMTLGQVDFLTSGK